MAARESQPELLVIVGPTASGKSELAMRLARRFKGEIIAADSRTVYKNLDIGTAKPSQQEQNEVRHWGIDLINPGDPFTAADFKIYAESAIKAITSRGHLPIMVGGTGLYIDGVLFDFSFGPQADKSKRAELEQLNTNELQERLVNDGLGLPENKLNKRHLIRTIERRGETAAANVSPRKNTLIVGIWPSDEKLRTRIDQRAEHIFSRGILEETLRVLKLHPNVEPNELGIAYALCYRVIRGEITETEALDKFKKQDWQYARRQRTWFKRNKFITWFPDVDSAEHRIIQLLNT